MHTEFGANPQFDNPRAVQIRLQPFTLARMIEVGQRICEIYPTTAPERIAQHADAALVRLIAEGVAGKLGGKVGVAPRLFLKRLIDVLDRIDGHPTFDPRRDYELVVSASEMSDEERAAAGVIRNPDDIALDV